MYHEDTFTTRSKCLGVWFIIHYFQTIADHETIFYFIESTTYMTNIFL